MLINRHKELESFCGQLRRAAVPVAFDTEFMSERRYFARLCLVQVRAETPSGVLEALIDPFAGGLAPLLEILADAAITKIVHAGGQDLQIFFHGYGCATQNVFDTQIAAAFLGYGHQAGYAEVVRRVLNGPQLSKDQQFTDWSARPLSTEQMEYALKDVRYLPEIYAVLRRELEARGRLAWAETEFRRAEARACAATSPDELYQKFNWSGLSRRQLAALRELAATRDTLAQSIDKPPSFIVSDPVLLQIAKQQPTTAAELRAVRGVSNLSEAHAREFLAALRRAAELPADQLPERIYNERPDPQTDNVATLLGVMAQLRAGEHDIARTYLAPRDQLTALASWWLRHGRAADGAPPPDLPLLEDWRRELLGAELLDVLQGRRALLFDATPDQPPLRLIDSALRVP
ncbi:MAG: ribonuclease D, partial [Armatimonadota bacterium]|nr:ribonuclease D [Armatimonadota bacterium]